MPTTVTVHLASILQDRQDLGTADDHMVSTVYFAIEADGRTWPGLEANVKTPAGAGNADVPLEVELPAGYDGPMNYGAFRDGVERYYRTSFGHGGRAINVGPGVVGLRMRNNRFILPSDFTFEA